LAQPLPASLDATIIAELKRRAPEHWEVVEALRRRAGEPVIAFWNSWLGSTGNGWGNYGASPMLGAPTREGDAFRAYAQHLRDILHEREAEAVDAAESGLAALDMTREAPEPSPEPLPPDPPPPPEPLPPEPPPPSEPAARRFHGPQGYDDAALVDEMHALITAAQVRSPTAAALRVVDRAAGGGTPESKVKRLVEKYNRRLFPEL
jgi:hypothetical protein